MSSLEFTTIYSETHFTLRAFLENEDKEAIGEVEVLVFDSINKDGLPKDTIEDITFKTINSFEVIDSYSFKEGDNSFEKTPYFIWGRIAVMEQIYIYPEYRRKGYGKKILEHLMKSIKEIFLVDYIVLKPYPLFGNKDGMIVEKIPTKKVIGEQIKSLVSFYEGLGFNTQKIGKDYYQCISLVENILV